MNKIQIKYDNCISIADIFTVLNLSFYCHQVHTVLYSFSKCSATMYSCFQLHLHVVEETENDTKHHLQYSQNYRHLHLEGVQKGNLI